MWPDLPEELVPAPEGWQDRVRYVVYGAFFSVIFAAAMYSLYSQMPSDWRLTLAIEVGLAPMLMASLGLVLAGVGGTRVMKLVNDAARHAAVIWMWLFAIGFAWMMLEGILGYIEMLRHH